MSDAWTWGLTWICQCGLRPWQHYENCPDCGRERPKPPEPEPPKDTPLAPDLDPA